MLEVKLNYLQVYSYLLLFLSVQFLVFNSKKFQQIIYSTLTSLNIEYVTKIILLFFDQKMINFQLLLLWNSILSERIKLLNYVLKLSPLPKDKKGTSDTRVKNSALENNLL
jgi:hypothetical protein